MYGQTVLSAANQTQIQPSLSATLAQLAIDLGASADVEVVKCTYASNSTQLLITFATLGTGGNAYTLAASAGTPSAGTLAGGPGEMKPPSLQPTSKTFLRNLSRESASAPNARFGVSSSCVRATNWDRKRGD